MNIVRRHELLKVESVRRASFPKTYPSARIHEAALSGFFWCGQNIIACFSCNLVLRDNKALGVKDQHVAQAPHCSFLNGRDPSVPMLRESSDTVCFGSEEQQTKLIAECARYKIDDPPLLETTFIATRNSEPFQVRQEYMVSIPAPELLTSVLDFQKYLAMMGKSAERYRSFEKSFLTTVLNLEAGPFVDNGFFGLPAVNACQCFACGIIITNWTRNQDPAERHLKLSPDCPFMKNTETLIPTEKTYTCKACLENHVSVSFGCGHLVCSTCNAVAQMKTCHICRELIKQRIKIFFC